MTFRLAGTLPAEVVARFQHERELIVAPAMTAKRPLTWREREQLFRWYSSREDAYLDAGHGKRWLLQPRLAHLVAEALRQFHGQRYDLRAWVVMPNHVHAVVQPMAAHTLSGILHGWKSCTATRANQMLNQAGREFWQLESYAHLIRDEVDLHRCRHYTMMNPVNAHLCQRLEDWPWSSAYRPS